MATITLQIKAVVSKEIQFATLEELIELGAELAKEYSPASKGWSYCDGSVVLIGVENEWDTEA
jgi:hypothetical protein